MRGYDSTLTKRTSVAYSGSNIAGVCKVGSYALTESRSENVIRRAVKNVEEYHSECMLPGHEKCMGHICTDRRGTDMIPGPMCLMVGDTTDTLMDLGTDLLANRLSSEDYHLALSKLMLGKKGILRGKTQSGVVTGSVRMVILPAWDLNINEIYLPQYIIKSLVVPCRTRDGRDVSIYSHRAVVEGDYAIVVRPPTLSEASIQPMVVKFWDRSCIGLSPLNCGELHADFDGDEVQVFLLNGAKSIEECKAWSMNTVQMFDEDVIADEYKGAATVRDFMKYTTVTLDDVLNDVPVTKCMEMAKVKQSSFSMIRNQLEIASDVNALIKASIDGFRSIATQQLSQGHIGHISRIARVATMDFIASDKAVNMTSVNVGCITNGVRVPSVLRKGCYAGSPACVLVSRICAVVQQSYLDAHRAKSSNITRFDMASSFITGEGECIILSNTPQQCAWQAKVGRYYVCLTKPSQVLDYKNISGCYTSSILAKMEPSMRFKVAVVGIEFLVRYYKISTAPVNICALAAVLVNECDVDILQPTSINGVLKRSYRPLTKLVSTHWNNMDFIPREVLTRRYNVDTVIEGAMMGNFSALPSVLEYKKH